MVLMNMMIFFKKRGKLGRLKIKRQGMRIRARQVKKIETRDNIFLVLNILSISRLFIDA